MSGVELYRLYGSHFDLSIVITLVNTVTINLHLLPHVRPSRDLLNLFMA